jgi:pilus assembly protein TadC
MPIALFDRITSPFLLFSMAFVAALYVYAFHIKPDFSIGGVQPTTAQKYIAFALGTS